MTNIEVTGRSSGVPKVTLPDVAAISEAGKVVAAASEKLGPAAQPKTKPEELPSIITVEVAGYETPKTPEEAQPKKRERPE